jgi:hypothetical protein
MRTFTESEDGGILITARRKSTSLVAVIYTTHPRQIRVCGCTENDFLFRCPY